MTTMTMSSLAASAVLTSPAVAGVQVAPSQSSDSVMERLGRPQTPDVEDEMPEFKNAMRWPSVEDITTRAPLPPGYRYQYLDRQQVPTLIAALKAWYPGIAVGNASCHLRECFYTDRVCLDGQFERDFLVVLFMQDDELAGVFSVERDADSEVLYGRIGALSPKHRGSRLSRNFLLLEETLGRAMGMGMVYGLGTLRHPHMQATFERMGWQLIGITPGFDREVVAPGVVKRVYEALYVKVLIPEKLLRPRTQDLTPGVKALFDQLFPGQCFE
jgi:hypothetical protein